MNISTKTQWFDPFGGHFLGQSIKRELNGQLGIKVGRFGLRQFPDGETYIQIHSDVCANVIIFADLSHPDFKLLRLLLFANTVRDLGAENITLVAPYLPYMRQDIRFKSGEGVTSKYFARLLSDNFDSLVTVEPHFHRYQALDDLYTLRGIALPASAPIAQWIRENVENPVLIGPDTESGQWVTEVASRLGCDHRVFAKTRFGDREVAIDAGGIEGLQGAQPIIIDDIISTGRTMINTAAELVEAGLSKPICIAVHAVFAEDAASAMASACIDRFVTCNTINHRSNQIDLTEIIVTQLMKPTLAVVPVPAKTLTA